MSADYLDLLLGRANGSVPAAKPRIHSAMAPPPAPPVWGEVTEERVVSYTDALSSTYRSATPPPQQAAEAYMPPGRPQAALTHAESQRERGDGISPGERISAFSRYADTYFHQDAAVPGRASADLLPLVSNQSSREAEGNAPIALQALSQERVSRTERVQPTRTEQAERGTATSAQVPVQMPVRSFLPPQEFAPALASNAPVPQSAPESRAGAAPVTIRIDRIEVHAVPPAKVAAAAIVARPPAVRLDEYLSRRKGAAR